MAELAYIYFVSFVSFVASTTAGPAFGNGTVTLREPITDMAHLDQVATFLGDQSGRGNLVILNYSLLRRHPTAG